VIYNPRRMFIISELDKWLNKHPAKKFDTLAKKVLSSNEFIILIYILSHCVFVVIVK
jgi:hypothetical protein